MKVRCRFFREALYCGVVSLDQVHSGLGVRLGFHNWRSQPRQPLSMTSSKPQPRQMCSHGWPDHAWLISASSATLNMPRSMRPDEGRAGHGSLDALMCLENISFSG